MSFVGWKCCDWVALFTTMLEKAKVKSSGSQFPRSLRLDSQAFCSELVKNRNENEHERGRKWIRVWKWKWKSNSKWKSEESESKWANSVVKSRSESNSNTQLGAGLLQSLRVFLVAAAVVVGHKQQVGKQVATCYLLAAYLFLAPSKLSLPPATVCLSFSLAVCRVAGRSTGSLSLSLSLGSGSQ